MRRHLRKIVEIALAINGIALLALALTRWDRYEVRDKALFVSFAFWGVVTLAVAISNLAGRSR